MVLVNNAGVDTLANEVVFWIPTTANPLAITQSEITAATALLISNVIRGYQPGGDQASSADIRLGTRNAGQNPGRFNPNIDDITYVYDPQATAGAASNKHYEAMVQGAKGYFIDLRGFDPNTYVPAVGHKYLVHYVTLGAQRPVPVDPGTEGGKFEIVQKPFVAAGWPQSGVLAT